MSEDKTGERREYDVFVSFRGADIRRGFLSHLVDTFKNKQIKGFVDDKLEKGHEIWPSLVEAIQGSSISLILFSQDYASSRWCLEELVTILECRDKHGQIVIPVFYHVQPTDVRHQSGSYKSAFDEHGSKYESNKVQLWKHALNKSANLSGLESSKFRDDDELLREIVNCVLMRLDRNLVNSKGLVGIDKIIADVEPLIRKEPEDKRLIGIWGMGGIGKTTLAEEVSKKLRSEYQGSYFLANVRERSSKDGITSLKQEIFTELLGHEVKINTPNSFPSDRIHRMKVLVVLDDVNDSSHLEKLLGNVDNFGSGSRIIITTRDVQVLNANNASEIYQLREFSSDKALELFKLNAFNPNDNQREYDELSEKMVHYAKGVPLVLKVLARLLRGKNKEVWESELSKLEKMPLPEVYDVMKLSYDNLDRKEQQIFLDLACFFLRSDTKVVKGYLKSLLSDSESDNSIVVGLERLKDKALITFSENDFVSMHDKLKEIACEIVCRESVQDPGSRSWLWDPNDIYEALTNDKGTGAIRSIVLHSPLLTTKKQELSHRIFSKMSKLRFLDISVKDNNDFNTWWPKWQFWHKKQEVGIVDIPAEGLKFLLSELRFLKWHNYPLKSLPDNFYGKELVILKLQGNMKKLWDGVKNLVNLKELDLSFSDKLRELPDLSKATNLEVLCLVQCSRLTSVHPSIFSLTKLAKLNLFGCYSLTTLASDFHLRNLSCLNLGGCQNLRKFSLISENMMELRLAFTGIKTLPSSFGRQSKLRLLILSFCSELETLPELPLSLKTLDAQFCSSLKTVLFPSTVIEQLKENRKRVTFWNCWNLDEQSLVAIGLNVQINVMKFANQHLSRPNQDHVEDYVDYDNNYCSYQAVYGYPGSSVPEWLEYKTRKNYVIIDLSSSPPSPHLGFIFCFIIGEFKDKDIDFIPGKLEVIITISEAEGEEDIVIMYDLLPVTYDRSYNVCVVYDQRCSVFLSSRAKNQTKFKIEFTVRAELNGIGVSPVNSSTYNSFIQQMELRDSLSHVY